MCQWPNSQLMWISMAIIELNLDLTASWKVPNIFTALLLDHRCVTWIHDYWAAGIMNLSQISGNLLEFLSNTLYIIKPWFIFILSFDLKILWLIILIWTWSIHLFFVMVVWWRNCTLFHITHTMSNISHFHHQ